MKQVNYSEKVNGDSYYWISEYSPDGYKGVLNDTVYEDGVDTTDWCLFVGTYDECAEFIKTQEY